MTKLLKLLLHVTDKDADSAEMTVLKCICIDLFVQIERLIVINKRPAFCAVFHSQNAEHAAAYILIYSTSHVNQLP